MGRGREKSENLGGGANKKITKTNEKNIFCTFVVKLISKKTQKISLINSPEHQERYRGVLETLEIERPEAGGRGGERRRRIPGKFN